jgi:putative ABC transport system permease protein
MRSLRALILRLAGMFGSKSADRDFDAELHSHLQLHIDDNIRAGMSPEAARREAVISLGGVQQTRELHRDRRGLPMFESAWRDLRHGVRTLLRTPGFTLAGVVILALGIGLNSAIFTLFNAVVMRPLPFADADRLMRLWQTPPPLLFPGATTFPLSPANFIDWEAQNHAFERMAIYRTGRQTLTGHGEPGAVVTMRASADFLPILGLAPIRGRGFTRADDTAGAAPTVLLSQGFFESRFGGDPHIIGKTITLDRVQHEVVGIVPDGRAFIDRTQVWLPLAWKPADRLIRNNHNYRAIAKLKPGVSVSRAQMELTEISKRLELQYPEDNKDWGGLVRPLQDDMIGDARGSLMLLVGAVALVLLIACANLANLVLVRTLGRSREIALRTALGASRWRVVQQLLSEGLMLGLGGGLGGLLVAYYTVDVLVATLGTALPRAAEVRIDGAVLGFTAAIAIGAGLFAAFVPAMRLTAGRPNDALKAGQGRGNSAAGDGRIRRFLVISEVALALMLLVGAGLLMRSLNSLRTVDPGFDARNLLTATISIPEAKYSTEEMRNQFFDRALESVRHLPGVESAAWVDDLPLQGGSSQYVQVEGMPPMKESEMPVVAVRLPSPGYFATARIQLVAGRDFTPADTLGAPRVIVVSERTAQRFWPNQSAIGKRLTLTMMTKEPSEVVGVVREVKTRELDASEADSETTVYAPAAQFAFGGATLVVRTSVEPDSLARPVALAVRVIDPEQPVLDIATMDSLMEQALGQRPVAMLLLALFAGLAVLLASVGVYSVLAYSVRQRVREIGIRMALGAPVSGVLRLIVIEGLKPTVIGIAVGLLLASLLTGLMSTLLYGVGRHDPATFIVVAGLMAIVGLVATIVPAFRATRVDPIVTLRAD